MKRYPSYQPTGIPWLPEIPEGWKVRRCASVFKLKEAVYAPEAELLSVFLDKGVIKFSEGGEKRANATSKDLSKYQYVIPGEFIMNNQQAWRGSVGVSPYSGIVSPAYIVVKLSNALNPQYANFFLRSKPVVGVYEICSRGVGSIQRNLIWNLFKGQHLPLPPLETQERIVAFLDAQCEKIDKLVAAKAEKIKLLKEYRERLIADAVTSGIPGKNTAFKSTTIPWLPEAPEGWEIRRCASVFKLKEAVYAPEAELLSVFLDKGVIKFSEGGEKRANATSKDLSKYQYVIPGEFIMNNQQAWRGSVGVSPYSGIVSPAYIVVKLSNALNPQYANFFLRSKPVVGVYEICSRGVGSIQRNLIWNLFKGQHLPLPPLEEQKQIVAYIEAKTQQIDALVGKLDEEIVRLKEYRERLIADVVTGQQMVE